MDCDNFGTLDDGTQVQRVSISDGVLTAWILTYGCIVQDLRLVGYAEPLVLGYLTLSDYQRHSPYFGAIVGRCANRIDQGVGRIGDRHIQLDLNDKGAHTLHGGVDGVSQRNWTLVDHTDDSAALTLRDPDGYMGFPGNCDIRCQFQMVGDGTLEILLTATTDQPTLCNLAHHSYFTIDQQPKVGDHELRINASAYLPVDASLIPTGEIASVANTPYDFRQWRPIHDAASQAVAYDLNYCLIEPGAPGARRAAASPRTAAQVYSRHSNLGLSIETTEPGLQFYDGGGIEPSVPGLNNHLYGPCAGLCLEPQGWPDAVNHPNFPSTELHPGGTYRQISRYTFMNGQPSL